MTKLEKLADWMSSNGFATGHGDSFDALLGELTWQVYELRDKLWELEPWPSEEKATARLVGLLIAEVNEIEGLGAQQAELLRAAFTRILKEENARPVE